MSDNKVELTPQQQEIQKNTEEVLAGAKSAIKEAISPVVDEILHELRVHQIELEMQNEELKRTQVDLEEANAHYLELYDFAPVGYLSLNTEGLIISINLIGAKLLGVEQRKDIINQRFERFIADDLKDLWYLHFQRAKQAGGEYGCELPFIDANGTTLYYHLDCLVREDKEKYPNLRITLTDVTERKLAETEMHIAAAAFDMHEGMFITDPDNLILRVNLAFTRITGYSAEEVVGRAPYFRCFDLHGKDFYDAKWLSIQQFGYWQGEILGKRKNGVVFPMWLTNTAVKDADGQITHYVGAFSDISERKQAEQELRIAAAAFETRDGIIVSDTNKIILRVNQAFTTITGYSAEYAIGKTPSFLRSGWHDSDFHEALWASVASDGYWQGEIWNKHKNGEIHPVWITITAVTDANGDLTHYLCSFKDIKLRKQAEQVLLDARERLKNQVVTTQEQLEKNKAETAEINTVLNFLLKHREVDMSDAQVALSNEVEDIVLPLLKKLKKASSGRIQTSKLIDILETALQQLVKFHGRTANLAAAYKKLTLIETHVASMVRQGLPTKTIAAVLNISSGTVSIHRKHIRKKLELDGKDINLHNYLMSLTE